jgi:hypothetical protein
MQRGTQSSAASAVNKLAVRLAAGSDRLAELVRRDQDIASEAEALDKSIVAEVSKERSNATRPPEQRARARLAAIATERASLQKTLVRGISRLRRAVESVAVNGEGASAAIVGRRGDGAVCGHRGGKATSSRSPARALTGSRSRRAAETLSQKIAAFRRGLDLGKASDASGKSGLFDLALAHELHQIAAGAVDDR